MIHDKLRGGGGHLILGVDEKNGFAVTGVDDAAAMESQLGAVCSDMEPPVRAEIRTLLLDNRNVVLCAIPAVPRDQRPCHKRSLGPWAGSRVRIADGDRKLTDYEVALLLSSRTQPHHDQAPVPGASLDDLDPELLAAFLRRIRSTRTALFSRVDDTRALQLLNVLTTHEDRMVPTLAGLLAFGVYPQMFEPKLALTVVAYPTTEPGALGRHGERFTENRSIDGPIPLMVTECIRVLKRNMRRRTAVPDAGRCPAGTRGSATYQLAATDSRPRGHPEHRPVDDGLSTNEGAVLSALADGPLARADLEAATGLTKAQANYALRALREKGHIGLIGGTRARNARWAVKPT